MRKLIAKFTAVAGLIFLTASPSWSVTILPDPVFPNAIQYDDFYSYSAKILTELGYAGYDVSTGTGGLDLLLLTGATGATNIGVLDGLYDFQNPINYNNPTTTGTWSASLDQLVDYLHDAFSPLVNIPVFIFDLNQTGAAPNLFVTSYMSVKNGKNIIEEWAFDNVNDHTYDATDIVTAPGEITIEYPAGTFITVDNNKGSGKMDFVVYSPAMNLSEYYGNGYTFDVYFEFTGLNNGFEELFLTGTFSPPPPNPVPEPSTLVLIGLALPILALSALRRKQRN